MHSLSPTLPNHPAISYMYNCGLRPQPTSLFMTIQSPTFHGHTQWPGNGLDRRIWVWFQPRSKKILFSPNRTSWLSIAYSPSQMILWALSSEINRMERETDHSPSSSAELTIALCYTSITPHAFETRYLKIPSPVTTARHSFSGQEILYFIHMYIRTVLIWSFISSKRKSPVRKALYKASENRY
jgi:hypothetical protein